MLLLLLVIVGGATRLPAEDKQAPHCIPGIAVAEFARHLMASKFEWSPRQPGAIWMTGFREISGRLHSVWWEWDVEEKPKSKSRAKSVAPAPDVPAKQAEVIISDSNRTLVPFPGRALSPAEKKAFASLPQDEDAWALVGYLIERKGVENLVLITRFSKGRSHTLAMTTDELPDDLARLHSFMFANAIEKVESRRRE